jgi:primosomal protein N''
MMNKREKKFYKHCKDRLAFRYGLSLTSQLYRIMNDVIRSGKDYKSEEMDIKFFRNHNKLLDVYFIRIQNKWTAVYYNKKEGYVTTFLENRLVSQNLDTLEV